jgi:hypothetical protein
MPSEADFGGEPTTLMLRQIVVDGIWFALAANGYLLVVMLATSPRIWGYTDYPEAVRGKAPAQTRREKLTGAILGVPWFLFIFGYPVFSTYALKSSLGGEIPFLVAFLNPLVLLQLLNLGDVLILDWLIISKITPSFVIIPGTTAADYKDMSHHFRGHLRATIAMVALSLMIGAVVFFT